MMKLNLNKSCFTLIQFILSIFVLFTVNTAVAFYQWHDNNIELETRGLVRAYGVTLEYPNNKLLYPDKIKSGIAGIARIILDIKFGNNVDIEFNAYQTYIPNALQSGSNLTLSTERNPVFEKSFNDKDYVHLAMDRFALHWSAEKINLTLGRQAINLATTFYFTPNDFFAPFSAQTFYRVYKPGVDALRVEYGLSEFSQLSFISVLGYKTDIGGDTGWNTKTDGKRNSTLIRWSDVFSDFEATVLVGDVTYNNIIGGSLQGELFKWLGIRFEGHYADSQLIGVKDNTQISLGFEHRWESSLNIQLELFHNGLGVDSVSQYQAISSTGNQYLARHYSALGGSYEISPLLIGQAVIISNFVDQSQLLSFNTIYSLSDESELSLNLSLPVGKEPNGLLLRTEFGAYPKSFSLEYRAYF